MPSIWGAMPNWLPSNEVMHSAPLRLPCLPRPLSSVPQMFLRPSAERSSAFWPASVDLAPRGDGGDQRLLMITAEPPSLGKGAHTLNK